MFAIGGECEASLDVLGGQVREVGEDFFDRHARREVFQNILHGHAQPPDAGLAAAFVRLDGDELRVVHDFTLHRPPPPVNDGAIPPPHSLEQAISPARPSVNYTPPEKATSRAGSGAVDGSAHYFGTRFQAT